MKTVIVTGSQGFVGGYLCRELLSNGYKVIGIDNYSKYGVIKRDYDDNENFRLIVDDLSTQNGFDRFKSIIAFNKPDYLIAAAAMIGGISYFHKYAYDLLAHNERIMANTFDAAIAAYKDRVLKRIVVISSSMVYEGADEEAQKMTNLYGTTGEHIWPSEEDDVKILPPPVSTYGLQKLACEYYCKGALEQYGLPYTIIRPFNCVGLGEEDAVGEAEVYSGNIKLRMSHVIPDLINKVLRKQNPLHILGAGNQVRCYTHGKDIARGIRLAMESDKAVNEAFNISAARNTTVLELAELIWGYINDEPFAYISDEPFAHDVQKRLPDVSKARDILGFEADISLEDSVCEVIDYMKKELKL